MISYIGKFDINMLTEDTIVTFDYISDEEYELNIKNIKTEKKN